MSAYDLAHRIRVALGRAVVASRPLGGGCVADVREVSLDDGSRCVVKIADSGGLEVEAWMLRYLATQSRLPVPAVLYSEDTMLVLEFVACEAGGIGPPAQRDAADHLAALHEVTCPRFGLERDTVIGGLPQPNAWSGSWREFLRERRLFFMGRRALDAGAISSDCFARLERLGARLDDWIAEPNRPSLIHGDAWGGNVLIHRDRVAAFVDPAIYFADAEIELAFGTLFATFGEEFFRRYVEHRPLAPGFFELRRDLYNLYPLLVHAVLFGGSYGESVDRTLRRLVG
jgi:fructosamine-3-kinase